MVLRGNQAGGGGVKGETVITNKINGELYKIDCQLTNNNGGIPRILHSLGGGVGQVSFITKQPSSFKQPPPPRKRQLMTSSED